MTTNGNGHYDLAGTELADDGLDLVQKLRKTPRQPGALSVGGAWWTRRWQR